MLTAAMVTSALAMVCWPARRAASRVLALHGVVPTARHEPMREQPGPRPGLIAGLAIVAALAGAIALGVVTTGVLLALAATAAWRLRERVRARTQVSAMATVADALGGVVDELRAGASPAAAVDSAAADLSAHHATAAAELRAIGAAARLGCAVTAGTRQRSHADSVLIAVARIGHAWALAHRHGLPLADVLASVQRDLESSARFAARLRAMMAGPRASAAVLAVLPGLGIVLGEVMGARPVAVLTGSGGGQLLLVLGVGLVLAGTAWCARLTRQVAPS